MSVFEKLPSRWVLAIWGFLGYINNYALRYNLSVAIVAMVNATAVKKSEQFDNITVEISDDCPASTTDNSSTLSGTYEGEFMWDEVLQGYILSSFFYGYTLTQILGGILATRYGGKWVCGCSILITSILTLLTPMAARWSVVALIVVRVLEGMAEGVNMPATHTLMGKWVPPLERSVIGVFVYAGSPIGTVVSMSLSGILCQSTIFGGWPSVFYVFGIFGVIWFICWTIFIYETPNIHPRITEKEKKYINNSISVNTRVKHTFPIHAVFMSLPFWALIICHTCWNYSLYTIHTTLPTYLAQVFNFNLSANGFLSAIPSVVYFIFSIIFSNVIDYLRSRDHLSTGAARRLANATGLIGVAAGLISVYLVGCHKVLAMVLLSIGFGLGSATESGYSVNHLDLAPQFAGILLGISNTVASVSGIISPYIAGVLISTSGRWGWFIAFVIAAGVAGVGAIFFLLFGSGELQPWANDCKIEEDENVYVDMLKEGSEKDASAAQPNVESLS